MFMMNIPIKAETTMSCRRCRKEMAQDTVSCESCGWETYSTEPKTLVGKIKHALGIELSDIVAIHLEDRGKFFSNQEINALLELKDLTVLDLADVPNFDTMFYKSKRVCKPINRNKS